MIRNKFKKYLSFILCIVCILNISSDVFAEVIWQSKFGKPSNIGSTTVGRRAQIQFQSQFNANNHKISNSGDDKDGINFWYYLPRNNGSYDFSKHGEDSLSGVSMVHASWNTAESLGWLASDWSIQSSYSQHCSVAEYYGSDSRAMLGRVGHYNDNGEYVEEPWTNMTSTVWGAIGHFRAEEDGVLDSGVSFEAKISGGNTDGGIAQRCFGPVNCGHAGTSCSATITVEADVSPIAQWNQFKITFKPIKNTTFMSLDEWQDIDGIHTCPEQDGDVKLSKIFSNSESVTTDVASIQYPETTTVKAYKCWKTGRVYGTNDQDLKMEKGDNYQGTYNNVTLSQYQFDIGQYIWPQYRAKMFRLDTNEWVDINMVGPPSRLTNPMIVYCATNTGGFDGDTEEYIDRQSKPTIAIDSQWDSYAKTIEGLKRTGILEANGNDKNCVVNGGSTVFAKTGESTDEADKLRFLVSIYIPLYNISEEYTRDRDVWCYCGCDEDSGSLRNQAQQYPFCLIKALEWSRKMKDIITTSLGHVRLQLMAAEGIYRQGEEKEFERVAQCVKGANAFTDRKIDAPNATLTVGALGRFGTFDGSAGQGQGNLLDMKHDKYNFHDYYNTDMDILNNPDAATGSHDDNIVVRNTSEEYHVYEAWIDHWHAKDDDAYLKLNDYDVSKMATSVANWKNARLSQWGNDEDMSGAISVRKNIKDNKKEKGMDIDELFKNVLNVLPNDRYKQAERLTGWLTNHFSCLDFGLGGENLRPANKSYIDSAGHGQSEGWYNEGLTDFGLLETQLEFEIDFGKTVKWIVMDPALCGQNTDHWDLRNWYDNDNDGKQDEDILKPGALKDKIRTLRFQLSDFIKFNNDDKDVANKWLGLNYWKDDDNDAQWKEDWYSEEEVNSLFKNGIGEKYYLCTLPVVDIDESSAFNRDWYVEDGAIYPHWASCPIFMNFNTMLKSKFFYMTNATVQDNMQ